MATPEPIPGLREIPDNMPALLRPPGAMPGDEARERFWNLVAIMAVVSVAFAAMAWWSYSQVRESLRELRAAGLASLLESESSALAIWIDEKKRAAERWAQSHEVQREAVALVGLAQGGTNALGRWLPRGDEWLRALERAGRLPEPAVPRSGRRSQGARRRRADLLPLALARRGGRLLPRG